MASGKSVSSLRSVINEVTKEKLAWLEKQRESLKTHFASVLEQHGKPENKASLEYLKKIHSSLVSAHGDNPIPSTTRELSVFLNWIDASDQGAAIYFGSNRLVENWIDQLVNHIKFRIEKCEYSCLYANVMSQYMESCSHESAVDEDGDFEELGVIPSTKEETMKEFSRLAFSDSENFDKKAFDNFLKTELFKENDPTHKDVLNSIREKVHDFCKGFENNSFSMSTVTLKHCIGGLLRENYLSPDKMKTLSELKDNSEALEEVCMLVEKRIQNFTQWTWPSPVFVDFKRNIAGRYRAYMEEDIITAIILHYLGGAWSVKLKNVFKEIYNSLMWTHETYMMGEPYYQSTSIAGYRKEFHKNSFLTMLPDSLEALADPGAGYDDDGDNKKSRRTRGTMPSNPMEIKKGLINLISNEIHLNNVLRPTTPLTVVQTDVEWFGPSIVHDAVLSALKFFGATENWIEFFRKFLQSPLRIGSPKAIEQIRKRGSPISHTFTALFGETLLFIMDLYVNQKSGLNVYRIHDDFWFWSHNKDAVKDAWVAMQTFTKLADLKLNQEKSASVVCSLKATPTECTFGPEPLPQRKVKWGFVYLHSDGVYRISDELLEEHVKEMRDCLMKTETVMTWVHCHNKYIRFFIRNFVEPTKTLQKQHVQQILKALRSILNTVHKETNGDAVAALKQKFSAIWGDKEVIDAWVYWPVKDGGLNLYNPFLHMIPLHEAYRKHEWNQHRFGDGIARFESMVLADERDWKALLLRSETRQKKRQSFNVEEGTITDHEIFGDSGDVDDEDLTGQEKRRKKLRKRVNYQTWVERTREARSARWRQHYIDLLQGLAPTSCSDGNWMEWLLEGQLQSKLGHHEDEFVDTKLVPLSLISSMQAARVHNK